MNYNNDKKVYINNEEISFTFEEFAGNNYNMFLFVANSAGTPTAFFKGKIKRCKITNETSLQRDFIPCYRKSDNEIGLYDLVTKTFLTNQGTGTFLKGNDVTIPNSNFPQQIKNVTGNANCKIQNKNLFNLTAQDFKNGTIVGYASEVFLGGLKPNTIYICSTNDTAQLGSSTTNLLFGGANSIINGVNISSPKTATSNENGEIGVLLRTTNIDNFLNNYWVQIEEGSTATSYVEHQEQNLSFSLKSKNLFNPNAEETNYFINSAGQETTSGDRKFLKQILTNIDSSYTISFKVRNLESAVRFSFFNGDTFINRVLLPQAGMNVTVPEGCTKIDIRTDANYLGFGFEDLQIEAGTTATEYEPFYEYELSKIDTAQDYIYKENGKWYKHEEINKVIFNGSEQWERQQPGHTNVINLYVNLASYGSAVENSKVFCNIAKYGSAGANNDSLINICQPNSIGSNFLIDLSLEEFPSIESFKTYLQKNNMELIYKLKTPVNIEITDTALIEQLEATLRTRSYDDITYITSISDELGFDMNAVGLEKSVNQVLGGSY